MPPEPPNLRFLRLLVATLTAVMICGVVVIVALLVIRFSTDSARASGPGLPEQITLPAGTRAVAITAAGDWYAVVTQNNEILIFDQSTGALRQTLTINTDQ